MTKAPDHRISVLCNATRVKSKDLVDTKELSVPDTIFTQSKRILQPQMLVKRLEILVGIQKGKFVFDAICRNDGIYRLAYGDAFLAQ